MTQIPTPDYTKIIEDANLPSNAKAWRELLQNVMKQEGSEINNNSFISPFWRLIESGVINCTTWLIDTLLVKHVLPNSFLATATGEALRHKAWEVDITPKEATKTKGRVTFHRAGLADQILVIPAATIIQTDAVNGSIYRVVSIADTVMDVGETEVEVAVAVEAENFGAAYNLGEGYFSILPVQIAGVGRVANPANWIDAAGSDAESDDDLRLRVRNQWASVGRWHIDATYKAILMEKSGIQEDNIYFQHEAPRGPGTANAYILLDTGNPSQELITSLQEHVASGLHGHGDDLLIMPMPETGHDIRLTVWPERALTDDAVAQLLIDIENFIRCAFRENTNYVATRTTPNDRFSFSRLSKELHARFPAIGSLEFDQADIVSELSIPRLHSLIVSLP